jgi:hypothetical protein
MSMNELSRNVSVDNCTNRQIVGLVTGIMPRDGEATGRGATLESALAPSLVSKDWRFFQRSSLGELGERVGHLECTGNFSLRQLSTTEGIAAILGPAGRKNL